MAVHVPDPCSMMPEPLRKTLPCEQSSGLLRLIARRFVLLVSMTCMVGGASAATLIANGDFAHGAAGWWGEQFRAVADATYGNALEIASGFAAQDKIPVEGGQRYRISLRIRSIGAPARSAFVQFSFRGPGVDDGWRGVERIGQPWGIEPALLASSGPDGVWRTFDIVVQAPAGATQMVLYLRKLKGTSGVARFSRVSATSTGDAVTSAAELQGAQMRAMLFQAPVAAREREARLARIIGSGGAPAPVLALADHRVAQYRLHVGAGADAITLHAASELADYLKQITGGDFKPLSDDNAPQRGPLIVVGRDNRLAAALCPTADFGTLGRDGFVLCTSGANLVIAGATSRGTMYGVNWFLDRVLGVKWLAPDATYVPSRPTLRIDTLNERQIPRFAYREILSAEGQDKAFRAHNLLNGESHGPSFEPSPAELDDWDRSWLAKGGDASFWELLPQDQYFKSHPEWYAGGQLAMMNADVRRIIAANIVARLKTLPDYKKVWFGIHDMDWGWDMDADSVGFAQQHGGHASAPLLDMVGDVARQVREVMPGAKLAVNAYHWGFAPPASMSVPDDVLVYPMTINLDYSTPLNRGRNAQLGQDLIGWNAIARNLLVWDHVTNFGGFLQPTPNIYPIGASIRWLASLPHVSGYFAEGSWFTPGAEFASLRAWMIARLLWDPRQDVHALVAEYCRNYFGAAASELIGYIDLMHAALAASGDVLSEQTPVDMKMYSPEFVVRADEIFERAERAVAADAVLLARVRQARMPLDFVILVRRGEYEGAHAAANWQLDYRARLARFEDTVKRAHVSMYRQSGDLDALRDLLAIERKPATRAPETAALPDADWRAFQDLSLNLYGSARIVADTASSDGAAVRMSGDSPVWAVQFKFDKLPREGKWDLFVSLRVSAAGKSSDAAGVRVGSSPPMSRFQQVSASSLNRASYQSIRVPGGPFVFGSDHEKGVYVQAADMAAGDAIFVDRIVAIRHK
jgi:hypothetical protein